jgi:hypothetical protein
MFSNPPAFVSLRIPHNLKNEFYGQLPSMTSRNPERPVLRKKTNLRFMSKHVSKTSSAAPHRDVTCAMVAGYAASSSGVNLAGSSGRCYTSCMSLTWARQEQHHAMFQKKRTTSCQPRLLYDASVVPSQRRERLQQELVSSCSRRRPHSPGSTLSSPVEVHSAVDRRDGWRTIQTVKV